MKWRNNEWILLGFIAEVKMIIITIIKITTTTSLINKE
jgi:hypothetical protein